MEGFHACLLRPHQLPSLPGEIAQDPAHAFAGTAGKAARERCPELQGDTADLCCPAEDLDNLPEVQTFPHA